MSVSGRIGTFEGLEEWAIRVFEREGHAKWILYRGNLHKVSESRHSLLDRQDNGELDADSSFELLKRMIEIHSSEGGDFTIYIPQKTQNNVGGTCFFRTPNTSGRSTYGHSAIAGFPTPAIGLTEEKVAVMIAKEREVWEKDRKIEELEDALSSKAGITGVIMDRITEDGTLGRILEKGVEALLGIVSHSVMMRKPTLAGFDNNATAVQDDREPQTIEYDSDRIVGFLDKLAPHFNNVEELYAALDNLANKFVQNPEMYKKILAQ